jgi:hypothetical protein
VGGSSTISELAGGVRLVCISGGLVVSIAIGSWGVVLSLLMAFDLVRQLHALRQWHGVIFTECFIFILPRFYGGGSRATGGNRMGDGGGFVFLGWCSGHGVVVDVGRVVVWCKVTSEGIEGGEGSVSELSFLSCSCGFHVAVAGWGGLLGLVLSSMVCN